MAVSPTVNLDESPIQQLPWLYLHLFSQPAISEKVSGANYLQEPCFHLQKNISLCLLPIKRVALVTGKRISIFFIDDAWTFN